MEFPVFDLYRVFSPKKTGHEKIHNPIISGIT